MAAPWPASTDSTAQFSAALAGSYWIRGRHRKSSHPAGLDHDHGHQSDAGPPGGHPDAEQRLADHRRHPAVQRERAVEQRGHHGPGGDLQRDRRHHHTRRAVHRGHTAGTFRVIATQQGGTLADTSTRHPHGDPAGAPGGDPDAERGLAGHRGDPAVQRERAVEQRGHHGPGGDLQRHGRHGQLGGLYTAGSTAGTFRVIAIQQGGTLADTTHGDPHDDAAGAPGGHPDAEQRPRWRPGPPSSSA